MTSAQFKSARKALGLTQVTLAKALGKQPNAISLMERGKSPVLRTTELAMAYLKLQHAAKHEVIGM